MIIRGLQCVLLIGPVWGFLRRRRCRGDSKTSRPYPFPKKPEELLLIGDHIETGGVYLLYEPPPGTEVVADIVFFHGLQLDSAKAVNSWWTTWTTQDGDKCWPASWLPDDFPALRVLSVRWSSDAIDKHGTLDWDTTARQVLDRLTSSKVGLGKGGRKVVLVGHSMGGLMLKQIISNAFKADQFGPDAVGARAIKDLVEGIRATVFYGTPHHGAQLALVPLLFQRLINRLLRMLNRGSANTALLARLMVFDKKTAYLNGEFNDLRESRKISARCFAEALPIKIIGSLAVHVVPEGSACLNAPRDHIIQADHIHVCKPANKKDDRYILLVKFLIESLADAEVLKVDAVGGNVDAVAGRTWVESLLAKLRESGAVGLHGHGGSGKSTLARMVFNESLNDQQFKQRVWRGEIGIDPLPKDLIDLQRSLVQRLKGKWDDSTTDPAHGKAQLEKMFEDLSTMNKHCFIILDNVWKLTDLEQLLPLEALKEYVGKDKSWVLLTSRNSDAITSESLGVTLMKQPGLNVGDQRQALMKYAGSTFASQCRKDLVDALVKQCYNLPLLLRIVGRTLQGLKTEEEWENLLKDLEERTRGALEEDDGAEVVLGYSLEKIEENLREAFLNIALFFPQGLDAKALAQYWCAAVSSASPNKLKLPSNWADQLVHRSLLDWVSPSSSVITVHDALRLYAAKYINQTEYTNRTHSWPSAYLENVKDSSTIDSEVKKLAVLNSNIEDGPELVLTFRPLVMLRLHNCDGVEKLILTGSSQLRVVVADDVPKLRALEMTGLSNVRVLAIRGSRLLESLPAECIGSLAALELLDLSRCDMLKELPETIGRLSKMRRLALQECGMLEKLPDTVANLSHLEELNLSGCKKLAALPDALGNLRKLSTLNLQGCSKLQTLPENLGNMTMLETLNLSGCGQLEVLPASIGDLSRLKRLLLRSCWNLRALPDGIGKLAALQQLDLGSKQVKVFPWRSLGKLEKLQKLDMHALVANLAGDADAETDTTAQDNEGDSASNIEDTTLLAGDGEGVLDAYREKLGAIGLPRSTWLTDFLAEHKLGLEAAARTAASEPDKWADFLALMSEVQLLRVALMSDKQLEQALEGGADPATWVLPAWSSLQKEDFQRLPSIQSLPAEPKHMPPTRPMTMEKMEKLVQQLVDGGLLALLRPTDSVIRENLYCLGFRPALVCGRKEPTECRAASWIICKKPYLALSLPASMSSYQVEAVTVEATAHDQGFSGDLPERKGTYVGSWTWAELQLQDSDCKVVSTSGDRLYTNLHADDRRQKFFVLLGTDSEIVRAMNRCVFAQTSSAAADKNGQATQQQELEGSEHDGGRTQKAGPHELVFQICAQYPAWEHSIYQAKMVVHLRPAGSKRATDIFTHALDNHRKQQANAPYSQSSGLETEVRAGAGTAMAEAAEMEAEATSQLEQAKVLMEVMSRVEQEKLEEAEPQGLLELEMYAREVLDSEPDNKHALALVDRLNKVKATRVTGTEEASLSSVAAGGSMAPQASTGAPAVGVEKARELPEARAMVEATPATTEGNEAGDEAEADNAAAAQTEAA